MNYIALSYSDLLIALILILIPIVISLHRGLGLEKDLLIGTIRTFIQLMIIGYVLKYLFGYKKWYFVLLMLTIMALVAGYNAVQRQKTKIPGLYLLITFSIFLGALIAMGTLIGLILRVQPWYEPQYLIPISGMMLGNAMNAAALAVDRLMADCRSRRWEIEAALALGASPLIAITPMLRDAGRAAMMPTINAMMVVGIVQLPGMMTGQIIGGVAPEQSVRYQIIIMYMLTTSVTIACMTILYLFYRKIFTKHDQLNFDLLL
ncbi:MAG: iron export ABC transporter permease subunit FetB [candidate division KSB1 bacterium]|nr:iron export ABC transporter permease subunit FetB [candidate division KSB1 bacterium]MDZ7334279.1 iron export ABC transporter permease subunit FetB [candidate division KSB1 bacterium]MDZ7356503.1 iron export ABC transporter permease subunit FetB [candidate division KSB1 bacterium]MDZ7376450.1 iron export ABC transporter permease subunit FetB [candidate division KSB1 bacterium]MDZ7400510.1 iron export ABC transporter permease subunit FetB [candidate division KSB1 bacterium]